MKRYYLVGKNISRSISPQIHSIIYGEYDINAEYLLFQPDTCVLPQPFDGLNITYPFKESILPLLYADKSGCGSVNTVKKIYNNSMITDKKAKLLDDYSGKGQVSNSDFLLYGYSTDGQGFVLDAKRLRLNLTNVLIIGTGGAARSIAAALNALNCKITVFSRTYYKALSFAKAFGCEIFNSNTLDEKIKQSAHSVLPANQTEIFGKRINPNIDDASELLSGFTSIKHYSLVINCTPVRLDFLLSLPYYDIKYAEGCNGLGMLIYQAILADNIFFDINIDLKIFDLIKGVLANKNY